MSAAERTEHTGAGNGASTGALERRGRSIPGGIGVIAVIVLLWMVSGQIGLVGGAVLAVAWAVLPATYAFAIGQVAFVAVTRQAGLLDTGLLALALVEVGLLGVLVGPSLRSTRGRRTAAATLLGTAVLGGVALASYALWDRVWIAAAVLVGVGALGAYGLHRYELVVLGKVPAPDDEGLDVDDGDLDSNDEGPDPNDSGLGSRDDPNPGDGLGPNGEAGEPT